MKEMPQSNSPFPGMDPYLERFWRDVHHGLITYARDQLQPRLPADLRARVQERVFVETEDREGRGVYPDVHVVEHGRKAATPLPPAADAGVAVAEPLVVRVSVEPATQGYIEIIDSGTGGRVVTVIEFLSPSNKAPGPGQELYLQKQSEALAADTNLVEIDLTRVGRRQLALAPDRIPPSHRTTYQVCVHRGSDRLAFEVYRVPLRERLPMIRVPLRDADPDLPLDLQVLIDQCYANGRYGEDLDYSAQPHPPLDPADAAWADELLRTASVHPA